MPRPYPKEFRDGALQLVREGERPIAQIAHDLGIAESCLKRWIKQAELDSGRRDDGLMSGDRAELRRLRRENARRRQETEILRKRPPSSPGRRSGERVSVHRGGEGQLPDLPDVPDARRLEIGISGVAAPAPV